MKLLTRIVYNRRLQAARCYSSGDDDGYLVRRLRDLKEHSTVNKEDPLVKLSENADNDWPSEEDRINADMVLEVIDAQKRTSSKYGDERKLQPRPGNTDSKAQKEAFQFINNTPGLTFQEKLERAQNRAVRYKLRNEKIQEAKDRKEQLQFRELYAERFTPIGSLEKLESLAEKRIEESMKQGGFKDVEKVRGKPNELPRPNQHVSTTEHYLNQILLKQNIAPPWIESQSNVNRNIADFRLQLSNGFRRELVAILKKFKIFDDCSEVKTVRKSIARNYGSVDAFLENCFRKWKNSNVSWADTEVTAINSGLRSYNLQAPLSTQKFYLLLDREFQRVLDSVDFNALINNEIIVLKKKGAQSHSKKTPTLSTLFKLW